MVCALATLLTVVTDPFLQDYSNPLTRFCMRDYLEDGRGSMSQVHHGSKMLHELPEELLAPSVHVDGKIYFRNELLQSTAGFFIPILFFKAISLVATPGNRVCRSLHWDIWLYAQRYDYVSLILNTSDLFLCREAFQ